MACIHESTKLSLTFLLQNDEHPVVARENVIKLGHSILGVMMTSHPYISGPGNIAQMIAFLRKSFPSTVTSDTVKRLGVAPNNESYVVNALQFLGIIDEEGKRTEQGQDVFTKHDDNEFKTAFEGLVRVAYKDLFELRGEDAWTVDKNGLINFFRSVDKTGDVIGTRQAGVFQTLRALTGREPMPAAKNTAASKSPSRPLPKTIKQKPSVVSGKQAGLSLPNSQSIHQDPAAVVRPPKKDMALTVRVEINLPTDASAETYDNIFKSIKAHLLNE